MAKLRTPVVLIGPFPPPVHGFSMIMDALANRVEAFGVSGRLDQSSKDLRGTRGHIVRLYKCIFTFFSVLFSGFEPRIYVVGVNGGGGMIYTLVHLLAVVSRRRSGYLYHHSYAYINRKSLVMRFICFLGGARLGHIFLDGAMLFAFGKMYDVRGDVFSLPNAAFVPDHGACINLDTANKSKLIRIGFLSNLTREKGLYEFLRLAREVRIAGLPVEVVLAGPIVSSVDKEAVARAQCLGDLTWVGPKYGDEKGIFFASLDLFVFPTEYQNEAQPIVIYEALSVGARVISKDRGSVACQIGKAGVVVDRREDFVAVVINEINRLLSASSEERVRLRSIARQRFQEDVRLSERTFRDIFLG